MFAVASLVFGAYDCLDDTQVMSSVCVRVCGCVCVCVRARVFARLYACVYSMRARARCLIQVNTCVLVHAC